MIEDKLKEILVAGHKAATMKLSSTSNLNAIPLWMKSW